MAFGQRVGEIEICGGIRGGSIQRGRHAGDRIRPGNAFNPPNYVLPLSVEFALNLIDQRCSLLILRFFECAPVHWQYESGDSRNRQENSEREDGDEFSAEAHGCEVFSQALANSKDPSVRIAHPVRLDSDAYKAGR